VQSDGKVIIGGQSMTVNNASIARLNTDGSLDVSFDSSTDESVRSVAMQPDGKVLIGGFFSFVNGTTRGGIARLNADGGLDGSFNPGAGATGWVQAIALQSDGKVLIGRNAVSPGASTQLVRLNVDGSLDNTFNTGPASRPSIFAIVVQPDGKVLAAGPDYRVARHNSDGSHDETFVPEGGIGGEVVTHAVQADGKVLIGGGFGEVDGEVREGIARLNPDGSLDSSFNPTGVQWAASIVLQPDGKALIGGNGIARLNANGTLDKTFDTNAAGVGPVAGIALQPDGKVLVRGDHYLARRHANGTLDSTFTPDLASSTFNSSTVQQDGKILIGGLVCRVVESNGVSELECHGLVRLNPDGSLDSGFQHEPGADVRNIVLQPDGKAIITGYFGVVHGVPRPGIARLNTNGSLDTTFNPAAACCPPTPGIASAGVVLLQPDGRMLVAGSYRLGDGIISAGLFRLNVDGSLDNSFDAHSGVYVDVRSMSLQPDGRLVLSGGSMTFNGIYRQYAARLYGDLPALPSLSIARSNAFVIVSWPVTALDFQLQQTTNLALPNSWLPVGQPAVTNGSRISRTIPATAGNRFYRLMSP